MGSAGRLGYSFTVFAGLCFLFFMPLSLFADGGWEKTETDPDNNIVVYTREVADLPLREFWGEMIVETSLDALVALSRDAENFHRWMHNVEYAGHLEKHENGREFVTYSVLRTPWPVTDRDMVTHARLEQDPDTGEITIRVKGVPERYPEQDEYVRVPKVRGMWRFTPMEDGSVKVVYQARVDPGGLIPGTIASDYSVNTPLETLRGMREMLDNPEYRDAEMKEMGELFNGGGGNPPNPPFFKGGVTTSPGMVLVFWGEDFAGMVLVLKGWGCDGRGLP